MGTDKSDNEATPVKSGSLSERISQFEQRNEAHEKAVKKARMPTEGVALAGRIATEMVAGVAVGGLMGWALDSWLGTTPLFLVLMFFIGAAAGMLNVWRAATGRGMATGYFDEQGQSKSDQDENRSG